ncbi:MAG: hypothetical protein M3Q45_12115 [Chloroflexota bacterium]|nr:hypothetical protein [Chloroflexota bacterium]
MTTIRSGLQQKAQSVILQYAVFRWESAIVVAVTILLTFLVRRPFAWWPPFGWPLLGILGLAVLVYSSLIDAETNAQVLLVQFQAQFDPRTIKDKTLRQQVENALEYQRRIETQVRKQRPGLLRDRLEETANQITDWLSNIYQLALRLDAFRADDLLAREKATLPKEIEQLTAQQKAEGNAVVKQQLDAVIAGKGKHWQTLRELDTRMQQAALQMNQSLTALATIYSQVQLIDAQSVDSGRAERLQADIREQVARLNDLVSSINEVYDYNKLTIVN